MLRLARPRTLLAATVSLLGAACLVLVPHVRAARAAPVVLDSYRTFGVARGAELSFNFTGSIFEPLLHIGIPFARAGVKSQAGGVADATAGQVFPGDLISSQAGDRFPGIANASYPPGEDLVADVVPFPEAGPLVVKAGHVIARADAAGALADVVTGAAGFTNGEDPLLSVGSVRTLSEGLRTDEGVRQRVRSVVKDVELRLAEDLSILIGSVISSAVATSDGVEADATGRLTVTDAAVRLAGEEYPATIDDEGIHLPEELQGFLGVPLDLEQTVRTGLRQLGVSISTAGPTRIVDGSTAEGSVGGLIIGLTGEIPVVPVPQAFAQLIASVENALPPEVTDPFCLQEDLDPSFPLPLCIGRNILPGPGTGMVQTLTLGNVNAIAGATAALDLGGDDGGDDGDDGGDDGSFPNPVDTPVDPLSPEPPGDGGEPPGSNGGEDVRLTGLLARMPPGVLLGVGLGLFVLASAVSILPVGRLRRREGS